MKNRAVVAPLAVGLLASAITLVTAASDPRRALVGWIAAYGLAAATVLAAMILVMVLDVAGARWWLVLRGVFFAAACSAPLLVLLFVPIGAAFSLAYPWASPAPPLADVAPETLAHQRSWNNGGFFLARSGIYLTTWTTLSLLLRRADAARVQRPSPRSTTHERTLAAAGIPILGFTLTFASFDWLMSLQAGFSSNMFGLYVFTSGLIAALSVVAIGTWLAVRRGLLEGVRPDHAHALGRLLLMSVILWAYIGFFQLLLVWIADLPHEVGFYSVRARGVWVGVDVVLFAGRFLVPFFALLSRPLKRSPWMLACVAAWLLAASVIDFAWVTMPVLGDALGPIDLMPFVAVTSLFWAYGAHLFQARAGRPGAAPAAAMDRLRDEALRYRSP